MTSKDSSEELASAVRKRRIATRRWLREGARSLLPNLGLVGSLGWLLVLPPLGGALLGRWLDQRFGSGIFLDGAAHLLWRRLRCLAGLAEGEEVVTASVVLRIVISPSGVWPSAAPSSRSCA